MTAQRVERDQDGRHRARRRRTIDLRPVFDPASIAIVGASARSWIAGTVRDNLRQMGSATRCHFVNPKYDELLGQACYPSLDALPERPDIALVALNPLRAADVTQAAADAGIPAVIIPGGGVVEGGAGGRRDAGRGRARSPRSTVSRWSGPNCMGVIDLTVNKATYIGDVSPYLPRGGVAGIAQSGSVTDAFVQSGSRVGFSRIISCGSEVVLDVCDYLAYCLDDPETTSVILFLEGFRRPERFLALADRALELGKPIMVVKVGRSEQARAAAIAHSGSLAGEARATDAALDAAGVIRCADLDELLETAELVEGIRRTGRGIGRGRTGVVTVSTGEASLIADLAPAAGLDLPPIPDAARGRRSSNAFRRWASSATRSIRGAPPTRRRPMARCSRRWRLRAPTTSSSRSTTSPTSRCPRRSRRPTRSRARYSTRRATGRTLLPVYVSLTSGEPPPETKAVLDEQGGGAPLLRGADRGLPGDRLHGALAATSRERVGPEARGAPIWPALAADRSVFGLDPAARPGQHTPAASGARRAREPRAAPARRAGRDAGGRRARRGRRRRGGATARWTRGRPQDRCAGPGAQERPRARPARRSAATTRSGRQPRDCWRLRAQRAGSTRVGSSSSRWPNRASS